MTTSDDAPDAERPEPPVPWPRTKEASALTRFVIGPDVALRLARDDVVVPAGHALVAPTLLRSQVLSSLYRAMRAGEVSKTEADRCLDHVRALRIRLLGDRVSQRVAWQIAQQLDWPDTLDAEYVAVARLQADAFVTLDARLAKAVADVVPVATFEALVTTPGA